MGTVVSQVSFESGIHAACQADVLRRVNDLLSYAWGKRGGKFKPYALLGGMGKVCDANGRKNAF